MKNFILSLLGPIDKVDVIEAAALLGGFGVFMGLVAIVCYSIK